MREEAEKARDAALSAKHEAQRQREEFEHKAQELQRQAAKAAALREWRSRLQPNDRAMVQRFGKEGRIVRVGRKKNVAGVWWGVGQWEVQLEEVGMLEV